MKKNSEINVLEISLNNEKPEKEIKRESCNGIRLINGIFGNQSQTLFSISTNLGIILFSKKLEEKKEIIIPEFKTGILLAVPNYETNLFAVVPNNYKAKSESKEIYIWDETQRSINKILNLDSEIKNMFFTTKKWFLVHTAQKIVVFDQTNNFQKIILYEDEFQQSILTISDMNFIFAFLNKNKIHLLVLNNNSNSFFDSEHCFTPFAKEDTEYISFSENSKFILCASKQFNKVRVFDIQDPSVFKTEIHLSNPLPNYFKIHIRKIYLITEHILLLFYNDNSFRLLDNSKIVDKYIYKSFLFFDFKLSPDHFILEKNEFNNPLIFTEVVYYDVKTNTVDFVKIKLFHIDGFFYELVYSALKRDLKKKTGYQWFHSINLDKSSSKGFLIM